MFLNVFLFWVLYQAVRAVLIKRPKPQCWTFSVESGILSIVEYRCGVLIVDYRRVASGMSLVSCNFRWQIRTYIPKKTFGIFKVKFIGLKYEI
jgi:hypothetical protein